MKYNIIPVAHKDKKLRKGLYPIYIFVYSGFKLITKKSIGLKVHPSNCNADKRQVKNRKRPCRQRFYYHQILASTSQLISIIDSPQCFQPSL